ncbi:lysozyme inhibitor LprI family protein [Rhizobium halophytocola]|uniref:Uncharacterized protein YecT (DUF1311 family) n=1 Tax=Rhizobium halophytocola TaxID=735519 RepID=A0ABS4DSS9_9HYPH|nr:lysozyme inhibitor LprI family protein [Rhizobium halophytocola]MBP1848689.1 uncharacterized protein YecT (DUF1311 family) [Rhizobium halophytocola]
MMKLLALFVVCGCVVLADGPAYSDDTPEVDCDNANTQMEMNICAGEDYDAADADLNAQWKITRKAMADIDADIDEPDDQGAEKALLAAQRAWIQYRDGQCEAVAFGYYGGSMRPMVEQSCLADLTRKRTEELKAMIEEP